ncbi:hypothetical protein Tsubulata_035828 [Turnera subulata]|uniref:DUF4283 domain-containing protein n=1 Tax=Turnera subulata TaxID=218843 RepID=A0A9Q0JNJ3_9ROSI|nr:hypothetical protein Tsubulata_035828 [Turnera subulata]
MSDSLKLTLYSESADENPNLDGYETFAAMALRRSKTVLVGKIASIRSFGVNFLKPIVKKLWGCAGEVEVVQKGFNLFLFIFGDETDVQYVVQNTPWFTSNFHLIIKLWLPHLTWEQLDFSKSCIWVHVHGLPLPQLNERNAERIGNLFEGLLEYEVEVDNIVQASGILMIKTELWVDKPLLTGFTNVFTEEWQPWVPFKYENLPDLCWFYGRIGHLMPKCWLKGDDDKLPIYDIPEKDFGPWGHDRCGHGWFGGGYRGPCGVKCTTTNLAIPSSSTTPNWADMNEALPGLGHLGQLGSSVETRSWKTRARNVGPPSFEPIPLAEPIVTQPLGEFGSSNSVAGETEDEVVLSDKAVVADQKPRSRK